MQEFRSGECVFARLVRADEQQGRLRFFSEDCEAIQAGTWSYEQGTVLSAHIHNEVKRTVLRTCEVLYVISGGLRADIYDESGARAAETEVYAGDILILLAGGHGYEILKNGTRVLEIKNGPYPGAEQDRRRI